MPVKKRKGKRPETFEEEVERYAVMVLKRKIRATMPYQKLPPKSEERVKLYKRPSVIRNAQFNISYGIIEHMKQLREGMPHYKLYREPGHIDNAQFMKFSDPMIPAILLRLEPPALASGGSRLTQPPNSQRFMCNIYAERIGLRDDMVSRTVKHIWWEEQKGVLLLFNREDMVHRDHPDMVDIEELPRVMTELKN